MQTVTSSDGTTIAYERVGEGPALVFALGAFNTRQSGADLAAQLAPRFSVFTYDRRGRGDSGDTPPYAVEREIDDLAALITAAGGSACVYGHSSGAVLALAAAARGLPIAKLALYEPPFIVDQSRPIPAPDFAARLNVLLAAGKRGDAAELFMTEAVEIPPAVVAQIRQGPGWPWMEAVAHTLPYDVAITAGYQTGDGLSVARWAAVTTPALVMDGGASPAWMQHGVRLLAETMPHAQHRTLAGQTHAVDPKLLAPILEGFLAS